LLLFCFVSRFIGFFAKPIVSFVWIGFAYRAAALFLRDRIVADGWSRRKLNG
jgi:hypothetical protein